MGKSELLLPAGSLLKLKTAILYGADAVYAGTPDMSLRTQSKFSLEELEEGIDFVHKKGKKIYLTLNLFIHNKEAEKLPQFVSTLRKLSPDGVLISDPGVFDFVGENAPELNRFVSTQANVCSTPAVRFWEKMGAKLCVLGRETSFEETKEIRKACPNIKLETFIHGSMCMSYSGRCLISNFLTDRSANMGKCAHCCRWHYTLNIKMKDGTIKPLEITEENKNLFEFFLVEDFRQGEYYEISEDDKGGYILNSKDMCLMPKLKEILDLELDSLKVEGRNKTEYYVATVARAYRAAIDDYLKNKEKWSPETYMKELYCLQNRGYCLGFFDGHLTNLSQNYEYTRGMGDYVFAGSIVKWDGDDAIFEIRNYINGGNQIEFLMPGRLENIKISLQEFEDAETRLITERVSAGEGKKIRIHPASWNRPIEKIKQCLPELTIARKYMPLTEKNAEMDSSKKEAFQKMCNLK